MSDTRPVGGFIFFAIILAIAWFVSHQATKKRRLAWRQVAADLGLELSESRHLRLTGSFGTKGLTVWTYTRGSGKNRSNFTGYQITYPSSAPNVRIKRQGGLSFISKAFGRDDVELGDPMFDDEVLIETDDQASLDAFLTPARRAAVLGVFDRWRSAEVLGSSIQISHSGFDSKPAIMTSTIRRLVDVADLLGDAPPPHLAAALEERLAGDLAASTQHLHEHHAADPADEPNVAEYLIEAEAQIENADHREAGRVAERLEQILGDDEEVAGWSRLARQPVPTEPDSAAVGSIGWEELTHDLFTNRRGYEIAERFEQLHMHRTITWSGRVTSARDYRIDADFGGDPGVKATIELGKITTHRGYEERVGAVVQLPEDTRLHSGAEVSFSGELIRLDRFARHFYVAGATLE